MPTTIANRLAGIDRSASSISLNSKIIAHLLQDLPRKQREALRDFYTRNGDEDTVCARYDLSLVGFRHLRRQLISQFTEKRNAGTRKPRVSAFGVQPADLRLSA
jgi:hypothetical protein